MSINKIFSVCQDLRPASTPSSPITSPKSSYARKRTLRAFDDTEKDIFLSWSMLPRLFADWDLDGNGTIDRQELLYGIDTFCKIHGVDFYGQGRREILEGVDINNDGVFDQAEFTAFLTEFSKTANVSLFDVVYFMMEFLEERDEWDHNYDALRNGGDTMQAKMVHLWGQWRTAFDEEL
eukprot:CAMPEP_0116842674 /NCGR_PEP_ID=MMETSP0418-20121206/11652_1 /TAXON_ID=1158023 /ORGANISM="Astrosyne radiata, Strain 13vi08-1A" /LENGTH=178 /DNA_ID=CAMNT_0004473319 /DNA_START=108 /DNA_END=644 /DNA_ORIENTATION=-